MQQINLYLPEFQPNREPLRSVHMLICAVLFLILLIFIAFTSQANNKKLAIQLEQDRIQLGKISAQVIEVSSYRPQNNLAALDEEILALNNELVRRKKIFSIVENKDLGNTTGFSEHLGALGRQSLSTVSLDVFSLQKGGNYVEFTGKVTAADQVPLYIQKLRSEGVFTKVAFGVLNIQPSKNSQGFFEFSLAKMPVVNAEEKVQKSAVQQLLELNQQHQGAVQ